MDPTIYTPIIVEATKFVFGQLGKWISHARQRVGKQASDSVGKGPNSEKTRLTLQEFREMEKDVQALVSMVNVSVAETNAYVIKGLVEQLEIHHRNLTDLEGVESEFGALTPMHVRRGIEREANAVLEKSERLIELISQVYNRIVVVEA